jgi:hypothetical protein
MTPDPNEFNEHNCRLLLAAFMEQASISVPRFSKAAGCSMATTGRILAATTLPTPRFIRQVGILMSIGIDQYETLTAAQKEKISEAIGSGGGAVVGFASISAAVSASGAVAGLSAAGITSGLASIGTLVGGGMVAGVAVAAAIPLAAGAAGYGIIKGVKYFFAQRELNSDELSPEWESLTENEEG